MMHNICEVMKATLRINVRSTFILVLMSLLTLQLLSIAAPQQLDANCSLCCLKPHLPLLTRTRKCCPPYVVETKQKCVGEFQFQQYSVPCDKKKQCPCCCYSYRISCNTCGCSGSDICPNCGYCCPIEKSCNVEDCDEGCSCDSCGVHVDSASALSSTDIYQPIVDEYRVAVGDILEISVFGDSDTLVENVVVAPDGFVYYFFLDGIYAVDKTLENLRDELKSKLDSFFLVPQVIVIPKGMSNQSYTVLGKVRIPGLYPLNTSMSLRQAIGAAGGIFTEQDISGSEYGGGGGNYAPAYYNRLGSVADLRNSFVIREGKRLPVDFQNLLYSADASQDIILKPGDYVYIASNEHRDIYVLGAAFSSSVLQYYDGISLIGALTSVGGWTIGPYGADPRRILIIRGSLKCPEVMVVDLCCILSGKALDVLLKPGDIVYVSEKKFPFGRELVRLAVDAFLSSFTNLAGTFYAEELFD